jgi:hypothetical protein
MQDGTIRLARTVSALLIVLGISVAFSWAAGADSSQSDFFGEYYIARAFLASVLDWIYRGMLLLIIAEVALRVLRRRGLRLRR